MALGFQWYPGMQREFRTRAGRAIAATASDILRDAEGREVVPHAEAASKPGHVAGRLAESAKVDASRADSAATARIVWDAPFAARAYFHPEWRFSQAVHGSARGRWMDDYLTGGSLAGFGGERYRQNLRRLLW